MKNSLVGKYTSATAAMINALPEDEIITVINRGQKYSEERWWWGDRTLLWYKYAALKRLKKKDALRALSSLSGIKQRTLRFYADLARFFEPEIREHYSPLPFSHFTVAKSMGDQWNKVLEISFEYFEKYNRFMTAELLEWKFSESAQVISQIDQDVISQMESFQPDPFLDENPKKTFELKASYAVTRDWIKKIDQEISTINSSIEPLPISDNAKDKLRAAIQNLHTAFEEAIKEISIINQ